MSSLVINSNTNNKKNKQKQKRLEYKIHKKFKKKFKNNLTPDTLYDFMETLPKDEKDAYVSWMYNDALNSRAKNEGFSIEEFIKNIKILKKHLLSDNRPPFYYKNFKIRESSDFNFFEKDIFLLSNENNFKHKYDLLITMYGPDKYLMFANGRKGLFVYNKDDEFIGYLILSQYEDYNMIEYILIDSKYRNLGISKHLIMSVTMDSCTQNKNLFVEISKKDLIEYWKKFDFKESMECPRISNKGIIQLKYTNIKQELGYKKLFEIANQNPQLFQKEFPSF